MMTDIADDELKQVHGGSIWSILADVVEFPATVLLDNFINPSRVGDDPLVNLNAGSSGGEDDGSEGAGGSGG